MALEKGLKLVDNTSMTFVGKFNRRVWATSMLSGLVGLSITRLRPLKNNSNISMREADYSEPVGRLPQKESE